MSTVLLLQARPMLYMSAAAMGFCVNALAYVVIQTTSSLTLKVLGTVKNAMVVWIGVFFLREVITGLQVRPVTGMTKILLLRFGGCFGIPLRTVASYSGYRHDGGPRLVL